MIVKNQLQSVLRNLAAIYLRHKKSVGSPKFDLIKDCRFTDEMKDGLKDLSLENRKFYLGVWYCKNGYGWLFFSIAEFIKDKVFPWVFPVWKYAMRFELVRRVWEWLTA